MGTDLLWAELISLPAPNGGTSPSLNRRQALKLSGQVGSLWRLLGMGWGRKEANKGPFNSSQEHNSVSHIRSGGGGKGTAGQEELVFQDHSVEDSGKCLPSYAPSSSHQSLWDCRKTYPTCGAVGGMTAFHRRSS